MVKFQLIEETEDTLVYWYFPEGKHEGYGIITINKKTGEAEITKLATIDRSRYVPVEEILQLRDGVNNRRIEDGEPELTEEEWPVPTEGFISTFFADHAISRIMEALETGEILKDGMSAWY